MTIRRGHLYAADLNPRFGSEPGKIRPVLVVQTDFMNDRHPSTLVCCLTTKVRPEAEFLRIHLKKSEGGLEEDSDIMIDQIRAIDNRRFRRELGKLSRQRMDHVEERIKAVLDLG